MFADETAATAAWNVESVVGNLAHESRVYAQSFCDPDEAFRMLETVVGHFR